MQTHNIGADQDIGGILLGMMVRDTGGQGVVTRAEVIEAITTMQVPLRRPRHRQPMRHHSLRSNPGWLLRRDKPRGPLLTVSAQPACGIGSFAPGLCRTLCHRFAEHTRSRACFKKRNGLISAASAMLFNLFDTFFEAVIVSPVRLARQTYPSLPSMNGGRCPGGSAWNSTSPCSLFVRH